MLKKRKGFTLIELLIVIAIILILIAIALPNFLEAQIRARVTKANGELRSLATAMFDYNTALISASKEGIFPPAGGISQNQWGAWTNGTDFGVPNGPDNNRHACSIIWVDGSFFDNAGDSSAITAAAVPSANAPNGLPAHYDLRVMTSPIEAITATPSDPFKNSGGFSAQYDYFALDLRDTFVLRSLGPDGIAAVGCDPGGFDCACTPVSDCLVHGQGGNSGPELTGRKFDGARDTEFGCLDCGTLAEALRVGSGTYSPTNGTKSDGDLFRLSQ